MFFARKAKEERISPGEFLSIDIDDRSLFSLTQPMR